ncbi:Thrombospondin type-1 domain-containing protein 4 [Takifugu flavidus]|uniref:Thrombospondin type-1 domain-containing protein 4 n=1 Tax=Takifugu flavidus TaxID=433684 RepID=A0A5C6MX09_9TELE|nr:Thrombospondin type-1 domain-containing protein 4 [Takifugu flavidus]
MVRMWRQLSSLQQGRALFLLHFILYLPTGAQTGDKEANSSPPEQVQVVRGNFSRLFLRIGYHKISEIPAGARNIHIQETKKSRNYLALVTKTGASIINGNWVIDRPGMFVAAGTQLMYLRPNEIRSRRGESITAPGPLTEDMHLYLIYQQPGVSVYYEYKVPVHNTHSTPEPAIPTDRPSQSEEVHHEDNNDIIKEGRPTLGPSKSRPTYTWTRSSQIECSASCGTGRRHILWKCVEKDFQATVPADLCDSALKPPDEEEDCDNRPCPAYWDLGEWSECSKRCGPGFQHRQVICRQVIRVHTNGTETSVTVATELCGSSDRPVTRSMCQLKICSQWEVRSEWSPCSVPCGVGQRRREVVCVSNQGDVETDEECNTNLKPESQQNCDMGVCARSWFTSLWSPRCSAECGQGNRTRVAICLTNHMTHLPLDSCEGERPPEVTLCDSGPCQNRLEWYAGPWGQCSAECGNGTQTRSLACISSTSGRMEVVDGFKCSSVSRPMAVQLCMLKPCGVQWFVTDWSACSRSCDGGYRVREVRCLSDNVAPSDRCDPSLTPESREECNKQPCVAEINSDCSDQYYNCVVVLQARLCIYPYYSNICCASCYRAQRTNLSSAQKNRTGR